MLDVLAQKRPYETKAAWDEAVERGPEWRRLLTEGMALLSSKIRDATLKAIDARRNLLPGADLTFSNYSPRYHWSSDILTFEGKAFGKKVQCAISREALDNYFKLTNATNETRLQKFLERRSIFENMTRIKYLSWPVEEPDMILVRSEDVPDLLKEMRTKGRP